MRYLFILTVLVMMTACQQEQATNQNNPDPADFSVNTAENPELQLEKLRIYPIVAGAAYLAGAETGANFKNLQEAMLNERFRITEKKPYGRFNDAGAVNNLTIQNKSQDTVFIMSGDVVTGGKQDRVIAMDLVVPPRTITDIPVFCVEQGRWDLREDNDRASENDKKIFAFTGYYNVASNDLRRTVKTTQDQGAVWEKVGELTATHNAANPTHAYSGLEKSDEFTRERDRYLQFFTGKFAENKEVIGMIAVSGEEILGADIFAHPNLFNKQYEVLLHSYITEAITDGKEVSMTSDELDAYTQKLKTNYQKDEASPESGYKYQNVMIHFADL